MKFALLLAILSFSTLNRVYAAESKEDNNEYVTYCNEQAELAGIENAAEKSQYIRECIESFGAPADNTLPADNG